MDHALRLVVMELNPDPDPVPTLHQLTVARNAQDQHFNQENATLDLVQVRDFEKK